MFDFGNPHKFHKGTYLQWDWTDHLTYMLTTLEHDRVINIIRMTDVQHSGWTKK